MTHRLDTGLSRSIARPAARLTALLTIMAVCFAGSLLLKRFGAGRHDAEYRQLESTVTEGRKDILNTYRDQNASAADGMAASERFLKGVEQSAQSMTGERAKVVQLIAEQSRVLNAAGEPYVKAIDAFLTAGGLDPSTLKTADLCRVRLELLAEADRANEVHAAALHACSLEQAATQAGYTSDEARAIVAGAANGIARTGDFKDIQRRFIAAATQYVTILKNEAGNWTVDAEGSVRFDDEAAVEPFNKALALIQSTSAEEAAWMEHRLAPADRK